MSQIHGILVKKKPFFFFLVIASFRLSYAKSVTNCEVVHQEDNSTGSVN